MTRAAVISGIGVALPFSRLAPGEINTAWDNEPAEVVERMGVHERTACDPDADVVTLAAEATDVALREAGGGPVGAVFLGTQTGPYLSRASAAVVAEIAGLGNDVFATDVQFAGKSGTAALLCALAWVRAGLSEQALAIGADTLGPHVAPGDPAEYIAGSGAAAVLVAAAGSTPDGDPGAAGALATIDGCASYTSDTPDGFRLDGERYIRTGGAAMNATGVGTIDHCRGAWERLATEQAITTDDIDVVVTSQTDARSPVKLARALGFSANRAGSAVVADRTGDTGAASPLIGLARALGAAAAGARIAVISYGQGAGSDAVLLTSTRPPRGTGLDAALSTSERVSYAAAVRAERRYAGHDRLVGTFE